jgi:hypothetical protein
MSLTRRQQEASSSDEEMEIEVELYFQERGVREEESEENEVVWDGTTMDDSDETG